MRTFIAVMLAIAMLTLSGCGEQQNPTPSVNLHVAAIQGNLEAVQQHIAAGSNLDEPEPSRGSTPLITAAVFGHTEVARALIAAGADVNYQNNEGSTALHSAAFFCRSEIVQLLLENGADKSLRNNAEHTALESVSAPFEKVKPFYDGLGAALAPLGLKLDYQRIETTRPKIAEMLQ